MYILARAHASVCAMQVHSCGYVRYEERRSVRGPQPAGWPLGLIEGGTRLREQMNSSFYDRQRRAERRRIERTLYSTQRTCDEDEEKTRPLSRMSV